MSLLILGEAFRDAVPGYRGTYRFTPSYQDDLPKDDIVNQTMLQLIFEADDALELHNIEFAFDCIKVLNQYEAYERFELVEMTEGDSMPMYNGTFLGYDLSTGYYSLISWGLNLDDFSLPTIEDQQLLMMRPLIQLTQAYFQPKLNVNGLFERIDDARFCLDCLMAMQSIKPGIWENEEVTFNVVKLWKVPTSVA